MITGLRLGNFKAFSETQYIPIRPLTLIFGPNSSGKSSLIHGLILARHAIETGELDVHRTQIGGESVDLGGFRQYVHKRDYTRRVEWGIEIDTAKLEGRLAERLASVDRVEVLLQIGLRFREKMKQQKISDSDTGEQRILEVPSGELEAVGEPVVQSCSFLADEKLMLRMSRRPDGNLQLDRLEYDHPVLKDVIKNTILSSTTTESFTEADHEALVEVINDLVPEIIFKLDNLLPLELKGNLATIYDRLTFVPISKANRKENLSNAVRLFLPNVLNEIVQDLNKAISKELLRLKYLGPLRSYPPRHLAFSSHHDQNWVAGGGYAWDIVKRDERVRDAVNKWLGSEFLQTPYQIVVRKLAPLENTKDVFLNAFFDYLEEKNLENDSVSSIFAMHSDVMEKINKFVDSSQIEQIPYPVLIDKRTNTVVSHRDIGIGISQVLPVLVTAYASQNQIVAIEQPEIHLHPALQAELGDVFIESALGHRKNAFILETHSEHLILRILRRIRETAEGNLEKGLTRITPNDVTVIYAKPDSKGSTLTVLRITEDGEFTDKWPDGFFTERAEELF